MPVEVFNTNNAPVANAIVNGIPMIMSTRRRSDFRGETFDAPTAEALLNEIKNSPVLYYLNFEYCSNLENLPVEIFDGEMQYIRSIANGFSAFPESESSGSLMYWMQWDQSAGVVPAILPTSWSGLSRLRYLYLRRNGYTTAEVNALVQQMADLNAQGMGSLYNSSSVRWYLNQTGSNANGALTVVPAGWTVTGSGQGRYVYRNDNTNFRIYVN